MYKIIGGDGTEYGPVDLEQIKQWIQDGRANPQTKVQPEGSTEWLTLSEVPELAGLLAPPAPAGAAPGLDPTTAAAPMPAGSQTNSMALTGMILGICSITIGLVCCGPVFGIAGIIFSIIGLNRIKSNPGMGGRGMAIAGLVTSILGVVVGVVLGLIFGLAGALGEMSNQ